MLASAEKRAATQNVPRDVCRFGAELNDFSGYGHAGIVFIKEIAVGPRQTRVFVPSTEPPNDWAETLIGRVFRPLTAEFGDTVPWFWFSRYATTGDDGDCDIARIPDTFKQPVEPGGTPFHRSMRFRFNVADNCQAAFEARGNQLITQNGYRISDFRPYDVDGDAGSNRFLGTENRKGGRPRELN
jgi:hypothetical protein